jgi:CO dehydrogenase maturation factor
MECRGTIGEMRDEFLKDSGGMSKHDAIRMRLRSLIEESEKIDLLAMGRPEGEGCYCFTNNILKECLSDLVPKYEITIIDNEAGMEHISRKVIPSPDILVLVSDPTVIGIRTASRLKKLAEEVKIDAKRTVLAINSLSGGFDALQKEASGLGFSEIFAIPHDPLISKMALETVELDLPDDSPFSQAVDAMASRFIKCEKLV